MSTFVAAGFKVLMQPNLNHYRRLISASPGRKQAYYGNNNSNNAFRGARKSGKEYLKLPIEKKASILKNLCDKHRVENEERRLDLANREDMLGLGAGQVAFCESL